MVACYSKYSLLCTLSIVLNVFTCSILESGSLSVVRCQEWKFPIQSIKNLSFLTPDNFQNVTLEKCYDNQ